MMIHASTLKIVHNQRHAAGYYKHNHHLELEEHSLYTRLVHLGICILLLKMIRQCC